MINRILIRIKVIQMLYGFMLTRSDFHIEAAPEKKTRDSRFAYKMYLDTLLLLLKLSGRKISPKDSIVNLSTQNIAPALYNTKIASALASNSELQESAAKFNLTLSEYAGVLRYLLETISESSAAKDYAKKRKKAIAEDVDFWVIVIESILAKDEKFIEAARNNEDFTIAGFETGLRMAASTLRNYSDITSSTVKARKALQDSLAQSYKLYVALLTLPRDITRLREEHLEAAKEKYLPTAEDLNPNLKFINNLYVKAIDESDEIAAYFKENPFSWENDYYLVRDLLDEIIKSDIYTQYMAKKGHSFEDDCEFWRNVTKDIIIPSDALAEALENRSVFWNDDINIVGTFVLKTMRKAASDNNKQIELLPMYKDEEDARFGEQLFVASINNADNYRDIIDRFINESQWDTERIALMDIVILTAAIAELLNFPSIPVPVTLNEYIEIANYYSSPRSGQFVNGILFSVINYLRDNGQLMKPFENKAATSK